ncbi:MAG: GNAT family N-acetyltransferase, partial [Lachnospiraceae bacterium]|nr:GNAT family N-acetyltransferase [Lachnospiraceae bacterium]
IQITSQELQCLSALVYETDPYIYPALFSSREQALRVLPQVFRDGTDILFNLNNCFIIRSQKEIAGLLLWHMGPIQWLGEDLYTRLKSDSESTASGFELVKKEYFDGYQHISDSSISIINVCVAEKMRGKGVGNALLDAFIKEHLENEMELLVLCDNYPALSLYTAFRFQPVRKLAGFSMDKEKPDCMQMCRKRG